MSLKKSFTQEYGHPPDPNDYIPVVPEQHLKGFQMYETISDGTPISPVFSSEEKLALWLSEQHVEIEPGYIGNYYEWLYICFGSPASVAYLQQQLQEGLLPSEESVTFKKNLAI